MPQHIASLDRQVRRMLTRKVWRWRPLLFERQQLAGQSITAASRIRLATRIPDSTDTASLSAETETRLARRDASSVAAGETSRWLSLLPGDVQSRSTESDRSGLWLGLCGSGRLRLVRCRPVEACRSVEPRCEPEGTGGERRCRELAFGVREGSRSAVDSAGETGRPVGPEPVRLDLPCAW